MNSYKQSLLSAGLFFGQQGGHSWFTASPMTCVSKLEVQYLCLYQEAMFLHYTNSLKLILQIDW